MASGRFVSQTVATDPQLARLSMSAELLYLKCIPHLDRDGICTGEPLALLGIISPMRFSELQANMGAIIDEWCAVGLVTRYGTPHGPALWFKGFAKQQSLRYHRERASQYPAPPGMIRTDTGIERSIDVAWTATVDDNAATPAKQANSPDIWDNIPDSPPQQQQQHKQQQQHEQQQQQQQDKPAPDPAAAAALLAFGITGKQLQELARADPEHIHGWIAYVNTQDRLKNPTGYLVRQLRSGEPPPPLPPAPAEEEDPESYEALKRRYVPSQYAGIIDH